MSELVIAKIQPWIRPPARWILPSIPDDEVQNLAKSLNLFRPVAAVLAKRGFRSAAKAQEFLSPQLSTLHDPMDLRDMDRAVYRISRAIDNRESILLYGDYDVDGTASVVVLKKALEILGAIVRFHVPDRLKEGYGMRSEVVEQAKCDGVSLIVSVDTGIRAIEVVQHANALEIDVIVTDHHLPDANIPPALAVLNPNRPGCLYPNKNLCGAGVTLKLIQALLRHSSLSRPRQDLLLESFLKVVAIATVADIVPLTGENRVIVHRGLSGLKNVRNLGLKALLNVAGFDDGDCPSAHQIAFRLAPRINAAGRMSTARNVIDLFLTDDADVARRLAEQLDALNRERQQVEANIVEAVLRECEDSEHSLESSALVFAGSGWHPGVLGIVASRLVERFCRPIFVLSDATGTPDEAESACLTGSGRSIPKFHLLEALESMSELFTKFGGHRQAAGLTLPSHKLEEFRARLGCFAGERLSFEDLRQEFAIDAEASFPELTESCVQQILALGPFGFGNMSPVFLARRTEIAGPAKPLKEGKHFSVPLRHRGKLLFFKAWNFGDRAHLFQPGTQIDVLFQVEDDPGSRKRGYGSWCLSLKDARATSEGSANG